MSAPKTVTKVRIKNGNVDIEYTSSVDRACYNMKELCRGALRDSAKFISTGFRSQYYGSFRRRTGKGGKATKYTVYSSKNTQYPRVDIGLKAGQVDGFYSYFQEVGTSRQPKLGLLTNFVQTNVSQIVEIQSQYLSALDPEGEANVEEGDIEGGE